jgi:hypothetical protein
VEAQKDRTLYDGPWIEDIDIFDLFWDERAYMDGLRLSAAGSRTAPGATTTT